MPPVHAVNLMVNSGNTTYRVDVILDNASAVTLRAPVDELELDECDGDAKGLSVLLYW